ncbi:GNAT family N-acetyltransferase [Paenibacillus sacheonensis]|uniref:GNAT family N-acetyltransferase n=1 Tax=Paenibacillus sacheonensis TaxID=742054 RepID=A0A7X5BXF6_9BACL|nr:GNAT family N-acetyltransferase [Paenibacillus sacheonensis]NBC68341.1 GNAT family N-acetyltransferase [Paenibacillus sacheonensis]
MEYPPLETERLELRILTLQDAEAVFQHFADEKITRYMDIEPCADVKEAEEIIRFHLEDSGCRWGLYDKMNDDFVGTCGFHCLRNTKDDFVAEIGFDLSAAYWGKGLMREGLQEIIGYGFSTMGLTMIDATVQPENARSIQLLNKVGFTQTGELRDQLLEFYLKPPIEGTL